MTLEAAINLQDNLTGVLYNVINSINLSISAMGELNQSMGCPMDMSAFDSAVTSIDAATAALREMDMAAQTVSNQNIAVQAPQVEWQSYGGIEVFNTSGIERYQQELDGVNQMMDKLRARQAQMMIEASSNNIFSPQALSDVSNLEERIRQIAQRVQSIQERPLDVISTQELAQLENLRGQLNDAVQLQIRMTEAVENMDLESANAAYLQLSQTVSNTERYIRDNVNEQGRFTQEVSNSTSTADALMNKIKSIAGAFIGIQSVKKIVDLSDEMSSTTARLAAMNDGAQSTEELFNSVYAAAERSGGSISSMASLVSRIGNNARDAFSSNQEVIAFSELIQKQMTIASASTQEASNAMLQLSQALGSGVLRGDELNSIFEQAPNIIQAIAEYMGVSVGEIRSLASEGQITADIVKAAMFDNADEINEKFKDMPKTWAQVWQSVQNQATVALQPVLDKISEIANNERVQAGLTAMVDAVSFFAEVAVSALGIVGEAAGFVADNWEMLAPLFMAAAVALGVYCIALTAHKISVTAATLAQQGFNIAVAATKALWAAAAVLALVTAVALLTNGINEACGTSFSFAGMLGGILMTVLAALGNIIIMLYNTVVQVVIAVWNSIANFINFFANVWSNPIGSTVRLFVGFGDTILSIVQTLAEAIDGVFGTSLSGGIANFRKSINDYVDANFGEEKFNLKVDEKAISLDYIDYGEAMDAGYYLGEDIANKMNTSSAVQQYTIDDIYQSVDGIADNTGSIADSMEITSEELKYLRDLAEMEAINRFTTAEIKVEMTNNNNVSNEMDLDGIVTGLVDAVNEAVYEIAEGVHV